MDKKALFIGPSKQALQGFDYNIINDYDYVARTNKFPECGLTGLEGRCDLLFINSHCARYYSRRPHKLNNYKVFVKGNNDKDSLLSKISTLNITSVQELFQLLCTKYFKPHHPYYGTVIIDYLSRVCQSVDVCGIDFYTFGFSKKENYLENYYDLEDLKQEEPIHSIKKDIEYTKMLLESRGNIKLLHKTKESLRK